MPISTENGRMKMMVAFYSLSSTQINILSSTSQLQGVQDILIINSFCNNAVSVACYSSTIYYSEAKNVLNNISDLKWCFEQKIFDFLR